MSSNEIKLAAENIVRAEDALRMMREQRARLGTGPNACKGVCIDVIFPGNTCNRRFALDRDGEMKGGLLSPTKDMMALALVKAWDIMIDQKQLELAQYAAHMADLAKKEVR